MVGKRSVFDCSTAGRAVPGRDMCHDVGQPCHVWHCFPPPSLSCLQHPHPITHMEVLEKANDVTS